VKQVCGEEKTLRNLALASTSSRSSDDDAIDQRFKKKTTIFSPTLVRANNNDSTPLRIPQQNAMSPTMTSNKRTDFL
jgi:hypothetical protein